MQRASEPFLLPLPGAVDRYDAVNWAAPSMSTSSAAAASVAANDSTSASADALNSSSVEGITTVTETVVVNENELNEAKQELKNLKSLYASISSTDGSSQMVAQRTAYPAEVRRSFPTRKLETSNKAARRCDSCRWLLLKYQRGPRLISLEEGYYIFPPHTITLQTD